MDDSPYHEGEREVQARAGVRERAEQMGRRMIRDHLPDQHRAFYAELPFAVIGSVDREGRPWASLLHGAPGFMHAPDERTLIVDAAPHADDPLRGALDAGAAVGLLGIQLQTRRRNRANGRVLRVSSTGFAMHVEQSFGNCPQYITVRTPSAAPREQAAARREPQLSKASMACIQGSDTCFIASASSADMPAGDGRQGVDVSHRGGEPGFIGLERHDDGLVLTLPDYAGNNSFNTLGNLASYPRAGLSFPDFETGDWLQLTGRTQLVWEPAQLRAHPRARRLVRLFIDEARVLPGWLPHAWRP